MRRPDHRTAVFVRAWAVGSQVKGTRRKCPAASLPDISLILVVDTETTVDPSQRLLFGSARLYRVDRQVEGAVGLVLRDEWLFYADDLPQRDPDGYEILAEYAESRSVRLVSQREFIDHVFWKAAYKGRATVVGFNLAFDLARLARGWGEARGEPGFSLRIWGKWIAGVWDDHPFRPRLIARKLAPGRTLFKFRRPKEIDRVDQIPEGSSQPDPRYTFHGHFLDLHTLAFALANRRMSLGQACDAFGVETGKGTAGEHGVITDEYIDYNRRDVEATAGLFAKLYNEYRRHPIDLQPTKAFSPASVGKAYLKAMGIRPPLEKWSDFPAELLGVAMTAYFGGRAECRIRHLPVPVVTVDFLSMYTTVCSLLSLWRHLTADRLEIEDVTGQVQELLDLVAEQGPDVMLDPGRWRDLVGFVRLRPEGDVLPVRASFGSQADDRPQIGINPYWTDEDFWYPISDVISAALLGHRAPGIVEAVRLKPVGIQAGLRPLSFRGEIPVDPERDDFFRLVIEERKRSQTREDLSAEERQWLNTGLKTVANATAYGITAEMIRLDGEADTVSVYGLGDPFETNVQHPEKPGEFCFPPFAAAITGGARLMLALLERLITDHGGVYANCDTDSMATVATENGGLIPCPGGNRTLPDGSPAIQAVTWAQVDEIIQAFESLHPYNRDAVSGPLLEIEAENYDIATGQRRQLWCYATSAKRYVLWNKAKDDIQIRKASEHGIGHLLDPTGEGPQVFAETAWRIVLADHLDIPKPDPAWLDRPAVARLTITTPYLANLFRDYNESKVYPDQVKPFGFMLSASPQRIAGLLAGTDRLHLVAPFETDPTRWYDMAWTDIYTSNIYRITDTIDPTNAEAIPVNTLRHVLESWATNPEPKSVAPDGQVCSRDTIGLLGRRPVRTTPELVTLIGKESNHLEEARAGLMERGDVLNEYPDPERDTWKKLMLPAIQRLGPAQLARMAGVDRRTVERLVGGSPPLPDTRLRITKSVRTLVGAIPGSGLAESLAAFLEASDEPRCAECGATLANRRRDARYCDSRCRMRSRRRVSLQETGKPEAPDADR